MNRRTAVPIALVLCLLVGIVACNNQTNYQLWKSAGVLIDSWLRVYAPNWSSQKQFDDAWAVAAQDILTWQPGTQCQNVEQAINDALGIIGTVQVNDPRSALILATAMVGAQVVETFFVKCAGANMKAEAPVRAYSPVLKEALDKARQTPPKDAEQLKKQWKAAGGK